jgi:hypothetical protein
MVSIRRAAFCGNVCARLWRIVVASEEVGPIAEMAGRVLPAFGQAVLST